MRRGLKWFAVVLSCVVLSFALQGCDDDDTVLGTTPANPAFNGTFTGPVQVTTPGGVVADTITMDLSVSSPLSGTILFSVLGFTGTISGDASGNEATYTITITGPCPGTLDGTMLVVVDVVNGTTVDVDASGSNCNGLFGFTGTADAEEICDDEEDNDGDSLVDCDDPECDGDPACPSTAVCGDNAVEGDEECDDGNTTSCDGCSDICETETGLVCGDGTLNTVCGEACDDGNTTSCDGCSDMCEVETGLVCGDGILNQACGEECDDGNTTNGDGCDDSCMTEGGCAGAAASDPNVFDCPGAAPAGGCAFDVGRSYSTSDFTCDDVCTDLGYTCLDAFDGDFQFCQPLSAAQACTVPISAIGGQPDMHCHCG